MPTAPQGTETSEQTTSSNGSTPTEKVTLTSQSTDKAKQEKPPTGEIRNPTALENAHERVKAENRELKTTLQELTAKLGTIESTLGQLDQTTAEQIKRQIAEAERLKAEQEETEQRLITKTIESQKALYEPQIQQLERSNLAQTQTIQSIFEELALQQVFQRNNGSDFYAFKSLIPQYWKPEYIDIEDSLAPGGTRKQVKRFVQLDGTPLTDDNGVELTTAQLLQQANKGNFGGPLKATFKDFNASNGDGFYQGSTGQSGIRNPWSAEHFNLTLQGKILRENRALAQQMAAQAGKTI